VPQKGKTTTVGCCIYVARPERTETTPPAAAVVVNKTTT